MRLTPAVRAILGLELRSLLRDPRTLMVSVVLPAVLLPAFLILGGWLEDRRAEREEDRVYRYALVGADSASARGLLARRPGEGGDPAERAAPFRAVGVPEAASGLEDGTLDLYVEAFPPEEWRAELERDPEEAEALETFRDVPVLRIHYRSDRAASREGANALRDLLLDIREARRDSILLAAGFPVPRGEVAFVETRNVASEREVQGARLGRYLTLILLGLMVLGGSLVATDTLAGEKERGTLETLLTSAASRTEIVTAKLLAVMAVALFIAVIQVLNLWVFLGLGIVDPARGFAITVSPALAGGLLILFLPAVALTAGILLLVSAHARTYKEAQLFLTPVLFGMTVPGLAPFLPGVTLESAIVLVPVANLSLAARDLLVGQVAWLAVAGAWIVTGAAAAWVTARSVRALEDERLATGETPREEFVGGDALFRRRVLLWFLVLWAVKLLLEVNLPLGDLRWHVVVHVGLVFGLFPLLVIRRFRMDPARALALRRPRPGVWAGVLLGAPAGLLAAGALFQRLDRFLPVPEELLDGFGQALVPEAIPLWQLVLFLAVIPGISEELTFRGVLLHGLRRRFGPVGLALVVGLVFGLFHFQLFRIPSAAFLGVVLAAVTLLTGSILPAIVWHTLNNGLAVALAGHGVDPTLDTWWATLGSFLALGLAFRLIWTYRTPYPDVGPELRGRPVSVARGGGSG